MSELKLFQHNQEVYDAILENLQTHSKVAVVQATGTGKGVIVSKLLSEEYKDKNALVLAPTNSILVNYIENLNVYEETVTLITYAKLLTFRTIELIELLKNIDILILDEFHRTGAEKWGQAVEFIVSILESRGKKTIGLSATPIRYLDKARNMVDELFEGNVIFGVDLQEAIERGILPTFKYVVSLYGYEKEIEKIEEKLSTLTDPVIWKKLKKPVDRLRLMSKENDLIQKIIAEETKELAANQKWLVFCNDINEMITVEKHIPHWFNKEVSIFSVSSEFTKAHTNYVLTEFNNITEGCNVLLCVNMLNEGVHIKGISGVIMLRKTISPIIFMQQLGRALTAGNEKYPIIFDLIGNYRKLSGYKDTGVADIEILASEINNEIARNFKNPKNKIIIHNYAEELTELLDTITSALKEIRPWSDEEIAILIQYYPTEGSRGVKKRLEELGESRTEDSIRGQAKRYELHTVLPWSPEEDEILRQYYAEEGYAVTKRLPGRTVAACGRRAKMLGVKLDKYWNAEEDEVLRLYYPQEGPKEILKRLPNKTENGCRKRASHLKLKYKENPWTAEMDEVLKTYYPTEGAVGVSKRLGNKTQDACKNRAVKLEVQYVGIEWTEEEEELLKSYKRQKDIERFMHLLPHRSKYALEAKLRSMGLLSKANPWTKEEEAIIREIYPIEGIAGVVKRIPNRTKESVHTKVYKMGVTVSKNWSAEEDAILREYYPTEGGKVFKRIEGRTRSGCTGRANALGLVCNTKPETWTEPELDIVREYYPKEGKYGVHNRLPNRTLMAIESCAKKLRVLYRSSWSAKEDAILKKYYPTEGELITARLPNRSANAISARAFILGVKRVSLFWTDEEIEILKKYYPLEGIEVRKRIPSKSTTACVGKAARLGLKVIKE